MTRKASRGPDRWSIGTYLNLTSAAIFAVAGLAVVLLVNRHDREMAVHAAEEQADLRLRQNLATHDYFTTELKPALLSALGETRVEGDFDPTWMSSTYAIREIDRRVRETAGGAYRYKEAAIGSRNPANEADDDERDFLEAAARDPGLQVRSVQRVLDGQHVLRVMRRGEETASACLRCHDTPDRAPAGLVDRYGATRGFGRKVGEPASVVSISIPLEAAYAQANAFSWKLSGALLVVLAVMFLVKLAVQRALVVAPLGLLQDRAREVASGRMGGDALPLPRSRELADVTAAFNGMASSLSRHNDELEQAVAARTRDLVESREWLYESQRVARLGHYVFDIPANRWTSSPFLDELFGIDSTHDRTLEGWVQIIHPDDQEGMRAYVVGLVAKGDRFDREYRIVNRRTGEVCWVHGLGEILRDDAGRAHQMVGTIQDITSRRAAADTAARLEDRLRQSQKMEAVGQLAGGVAHDFNNILAVIVSCASFVAEAEPGEPSIRSDIAEIRLAAERARVLTRQLLAFSRRQVLEPRIVDLGVVVHDMEGMLRRILGEDVTLRTALPAGVGMVEVDPGQMEQVILNLAVNARDAMPRGGELTIEVSGEERVDAGDGRRGTAHTGPWVMLRVTDTGRGMGAEVRERIFEPFFTTKERGKGTGLGLSTVHGIVTQSGGHVRVESAPGRGTTFRVYLPAVTGPASGELDTGVAPAPQARPGETVLLVEDDPAVRRTVSRSLEQLGYRVLPADGAAGALACVEAGGDRIDLLLSDVVMPGRSGPELASALLERFPGLRTLFMSGFPDDAVVQREALAPGVRLLQKPFTLKDLARAVREVLDGAGSPASPGG